MIGSIVHRNFHNYVAAVNIANEVSHDVVLRSFNQFLSGINSTDLPYELRSEWSDITVQFLGALKSAPLTQTNVERINSLSAPELNDFHGKLKTLGHKVHSGAWSGPGAYS